MDLPINMINDILKLTESTPEEFLEWTDNSIKISRENNFTLRKYVAPCLLQNNKFKGYIFLMKKRPDDTRESCKKDSGTIEFGKYDGIDHYDVWDYFIKEQGNYEKMREKYVNYYIQESKK